MLIGGFIAGGQNGATRVVVRAIGPSLSGRGVAGALQDPTVELRNADGNIIRSNDNWREAPNRAEIEARGLAPQDDRESALLQTIQPGPYTAIVRGKSDAPNGVGLVEIFDIE